MDAEHKTEIDRLGELANVGAGHAADAFSQLVGRTIRMEVPVLVAAESDRAAFGKTIGSGGGATGIFFEFEGCLEAVVAILFPENASEVLVRRVVGIETGELAPPVIESAIAEVGNILASHIASGIADTLGSRLLPSIPQLEMEHADEALGAYIEETIGHDAMRIESAFSDEAGELRGRLVMVPTRWPGSRANEDPSDLDDL